MSEIIYQRPRKPSYNNGTFVSPSDRIYEYRIVTVDDRTHTARFWSRVVTLDALDLYMWIEGWVRKEIQDLPKQRLNTRWVVPYNSDKEMFRLERYRARQIIVNQLNQHGRIRETISWDEQFEELIGQVVGLKITGSCVVYTNNRLIHRN